MLKIFLKVFLFKARVFLVHASPVIGVALMMYSHRSGIPALNAFSGLLGLFEGCLASVALHVTRTVK